MSHEIEKYEHQNRRMVPKLTEITFVPQKGLSSVFKSPVPIFHILTTTINSEKSWEIERTYKDFKVLRQYILEQHPDTIVPMLPDLPEREDLDNLRILGKCGDLIIQFLEQCFCSPSIKFNKMLS